MTVELGLFAFVQQVCCLLHSELIVSLTKFSGDNISLRLYDTYCKELKLSSAFDISRLTSVTHPFLDRIKYVAIRCTPWPVASHTPSIELRIVEIIMPRSLLHNIMTLFGKAYLSSLHEIPTPGDKDMDKGTCLLTLFFSGGTMTRKS